jgi:uncharacterized membrane protein YcaP (DUF421 family)
MTGLLQLFAVHVPVWELVVRGSAMYWFLFLILRFVLRRDLGAVGLADVLFLVLIADAAQNSMAGDYKTISEGMILVGTIVGWNLLLDWLSWRSRAVRRFLNPRSLVLIRGGRVSHENLARECISMDELASKLRQHGVERPGEVKLARIESDGEISVITYSPAKQPQSPRKKPPVVPA